MSYYHFELNTKWFQAIYLKWDVCPYYEPLVALISICSDTLGGESTVVSLDRNTTGVTICSDYYPESQSVRITRSHL